MIDHLAQQATPHSDLIAQIKDSRIPKNEREWAAAREIERLESALAEARAAPTGEWVTVPREAVQKVKAASMAAPHAADILIEEALELFAAAPPAPAAEPVAWEYRWLNPGDQEDIPESMLEWKRILPSRLQSIEDAVLEFKAASYRGKPCYEVRALGVIDPPPVEASQQPATNEPEWSLWQYQREDGTWSQFMDDRHFQSTVLSGDWMMRRIARVKVVGQKPCPCGDREASQCPGEWEPGCDLGANEAHARRVDEASQQQASDVYEAYKTWPEDIRAKLSLHDLRRMGGWAPKPTGAWAIDTSAGRPILVYEKCSVIEDEQARYVLSLIARDQQSVSDAVAEPASGEKADDTRLSGLHVEDGALNIGLAGGACEAFARAFLDQFSESGATNYLEASFDSALGRFTVTIQRVAGKTPHQLRAEAEAELSRLTTELSAAKAEATRLTDCLRKANDQAEHFEREWYLRGDELESAKAEAADWKAAAESMHAEASEARAEAESLRKDAERYRWLRSARTGHSTIWELLSDDCQPPYMTLKCDASLDAAIDAALATQQGEKP